MINVTEFIPLVLQKGKEGKLSWDEAGPDSFISTVGDIIINVKKENRRNSWGVDVGYRFSILNSSGNIIETYYAQNSADDQFRIIADIYETSRRNALKIDQALSGLMDRLKSL